MRAEELDIDAPLVDRNSLSLVVIHTSRLNIESLRNAANPQVHQYISRFSYSMEMRSTAETVAHHLDQHQPWFQRCEALMAVREMDDQTYVLTLGQFGSFGLEIEPTTALKLLPQ